MADPVIAARAPIGVDLEAGKTYYWCSCGKSAYAPTATGKAYLCACKHTHNAPLCDGSHKALA